MFQTLLAILNIPNAKPVARLGPLSGWIISFPSAYVAVFTIKFFTVKTSLNTAHLSWLCYWELSLWFWTAVILTRSHRDLSNCEYRELSCAAGMCQHWAYGWPNPYSHRHIRMNTEQKLSIGLASFLLHWKLTGFFERQTNPPCFNFNAYNMHSFFDVNAKYGFIWIRKPSL